MPALNSYTALVPVVSRKGKIEAAILVHRKPPKQFINKPFMRRIMPGQTTQQLADNTGFHYDKYGISKNDWEEAEKELYGLIGNGKRYMKRLTLRS